MGLLRFIVRIICFFAVIETVKVGLQLLWFQTGHYTDNGVPDERIQYPHSIADVKTLALVLEEDYNHHLRSPFSLGLFSLAYIFKQTFSSGGTIYLTILSPVLVGALEGMILCSLLQAFGSCGAYLIGRYFWRPTMRDVLSCITGKNLLFREHVALEGPALRKWARIFIGLRIFPFMPDFILNTFAGSSSITIWQYFVFSFLGSLPYSFYCTYLGVQLSDFDSFSDLFWGEYPLFSIIFDLILISVFVGNPIGLFFEWLRHRMTEMDERERRERQERDRQNQILAIEPVADAIDLHRRDGAVRPHN